MKLVVVAGAAFLVLLIAFLAILRTVGGDSVDCAGFHLRPGQWQAARPDDRSALQMKISVCRALQGSSQQKVQALLGPPDSIASQGLVYRFGPRDVRLMEVMIRDAEVSGIRRVTESGPLP